ncbi:putative cinnamoyl-CoA reductase [Jackrogersella minutella]|nr:putative cinnamoyl-CoA reductase [Jackrogersella minutella]
MPATFLITGATGLVGFRILTLALEAGHNVVYTARSEDKARAVSSNPAVQKLAPGSRLSSVIIPDFDVEGAFDSALEGITHVVHAGSPVPVPLTRAPMEIYEPTVRMSTDLVNSALKWPGVKRIVITSSFIGSVGLTAPTGTVSAATRHALPDGEPTAFEDVGAAYAMGKIVGLHRTDEFMRTRKPHFSLSHIVPGFVFGRNELALDADMMRTQNSTNNFMMMAMLGQEVPFTVLAGYAHIDDIAELHLRVALQDPKPDGPADFGLALKVDYSGIFDIVAKAFPRAVAEGVFTRGFMPTGPVDFDSSDAVELLGGKVKSFESMVLDVAGQYLETLGKEKA